MSNLPAVEPVPLSATTSPAPAPIGACANCGAPAYGPYCHACGQPEKGMIRPLANVMSDIADTIFNVDSRIFRSIPSLYFRPGFITREYFAGRRTRYVTPFRLFFFLCVISFFAIQGSLKIDQLQFDLDGGGDIENAQTEAEVREREKVALDEINKAKSEPGMPAAAIIGLDVATANIRSQAAQRLAWLTAKQQAEAKGEKPPPDPDATETFINFDGTAWNPETHPVKLGWLPDFANNEINAAIARAQDNVTAARKDPRHFIRGLFSVAPWTLFLLMPLFAVLLKIVYVFYRRLYMEHLIVALHSHAFIFMSLLLVALLTLPLGWAETSAPGVATGLQILRGLVWAWLPIYLFLMQKRVYRHGWFMACLMYSIIGVSYLVILTFALVGGVLASLTLA